MTESYLLAHLSNKESQILVEKNSNIARDAASVGKVFLAAEFIRLLEAGKVQNSAIEINKNDIQGYGTDVLADIVGIKNLIRIDALTLLGLIIKYSCNSSSYILAKYFLPERRVLDIIAKEDWGLMKVRLVGRNGKYLNLFSLRDFLILFEKIYKHKGIAWNFLKEKLKTSRNIYYLFDQLGLDMLGSKTGTKKIGNIYHINDCGLFEYSSETYFMGAMVSDKNISKAVLRIREIGRNLVTTLKDNY